MTKTEAQDWTPVAGLYLTKLGLWLELTESVEEVMCTGSASSHYHDSDIGVRYRSWTRAQKHGAFDLVASIHPLHVFRFCV
jgi:hypothetical protein